MPLITPDFTRPEYQRVTPASAGWEFLHFAARRLRQGQAWRWETEENELALVILGGVCEVRSSRGEWPRLGSRSHVFAGMPCAVYLPRRTRFTITAITPEVDLAYGWCPADNDYPAQLIRPESVEVELRGGGNATRQINKIIPPGFSCQRLVVVEVYTPSGNWSSYPPHKHDIHRVDENGQLLEADLEEVYFYKLDQPDGYALQRIYTGDGRREELLLARDNHLVLVPEGYHPVVSAHGYTTYYLNILAGSAQSLASADDPRYAWIKDTWGEKDPRLPVVHLNMEASTS